MTNKILYWFFMRAELLQKNKSGIKTYWFLTHKEDSNSIN